MSQNKSAPHWLSAVQPAPAARLFSAAHLLLLQKPLVHWVAPLHVAHTGVAEGCTISSHNFRFNNTSNILRSLYEKPLHNNRKCGEGAPLPACGPQTQMMGVQANEWGVAMGDGVPPLVRTHLSIFKNISNISRYLYEKPPHNIRECG